MILRLILFLLSVAFGILSYVNSDDIITKQFVVTEKVKTGDRLYLRYVDNGASAIFQVTPEQYIDAEEDEQFVIYESSYLFWLFLILSILCIIVFLLSLGVDFFDITDVFDALI